MGNSHLFLVIVDTFFFESQKDDFFDSINYKSFEPSDDQSAEFKADCPHECLNLIKLFETMKKENAPYKSKPADIKSNDFERTCDD